MGIGGGWYEHEWRAYGYGFPVGGGSTGAAHTARLDEGVQIMRDAWRDGRVSFEGRLYQVDGAIVAPKPIGAIPVWIADGGEKVTLRIAAKYAQYTNFSPNPDEFAHKSQVLAGRNCSTGLLNSPHRTRATFPLVQLNRRVHHDMLPNTARGRWNCVGMQTEKSGQCRVSVSSTTRNCIRSNSTTVMIR